MPVSSKDLILNFIAGGVVVAGTTLLSAKVSTKWAAFFWSIPLTLIPVLIFLHYKKAPPEDIARFVGQIFPSLLVLLTWTVILWLSLKRTTFWKAIAISLFGFIVLGILYWKFVKPSGKARIQ